MAADYKQLYNTYTDLMDVFLEDEIFFKEFMQLINHSKSEISFIKKKCVRSLETDWIDAIESYLPSLDKVIRNPQRFIENREEVLPIEISRNITSESVKHLAQHTNLISRIEGDKVTPSKILNVFREDSNNTYENRFVYTLLNRLMIFITKRYDKISDAMNADNYMSLKVNQDVEVTDNENVSINFEIKSSFKSVADNDINEYDFSRVIKLRKIIMDYTTSPFATMMKEFPMIKPPVTRTNALLKNVDLKNCLNLWIFIESYDKIGFAVDFIETSNKPEDSYINELFGLSAINYALFKYYTAYQNEELILKKVRKSKAVVPKFIKDIYDEFTSVYNISEVEFRKFMDVQKINFRKKKAEDEKKIKLAVDEALAAEARYKKNLLLLERQKAAEKKKAAKKRKKAV